MNQAHKRGPGDTLLADRQRAETEGILIKAMEGKGPMALSEIRKATGLAGATVHRTVMRLFGQRRARRVKEIGRGAWSWEFVSNICDTDADQMHPFYAVVQQWVRAA